MNSLKVKLTPTRLTRNPTRWTRNKTKGVQPTCSFWCNFGLDCVFGLSIAFAECKSKKHIDQNGQVWKTALSAKMDDLVHPLQQKLNVLASWRYALTWEQVCTTLACLDRCGDSDVDNAWRRVASHAMVAIQEKMNKDFPTWKFAKSCTFAQLADQLFLNRVFRTQVDEHKPFYANFHKRMFVESIIQKVFGSLVWPSEPACLVKPWFWSQAKKEELLEQVKHIEMTLKDDVYTQDYAKALCTIKWLQRLDKPTKTKVEHVTHMCKLLNLLSCKTTIIKTSDQQVGFLEYNDNDKVNRIVDLIRTTYGESRTMMNLAKEIKDLQTINASTIRSIQVLNELRQMVAYLRFEDSICLNACYEALETAYVLEINEMDRLCGDCLPCGACVVALRPRPHKSRRD